MYQMACRGISDPIPLCTPPPVDVEPQESARHLRREPNDISPRSRTCHATVLTHADRLRPVGPATDDPRVIRKPTLVIEGTEMSAR